MINPSPSLNRGTVWAIADLHLCLGAPEKSMACFGPLWVNYMEKIKEHWHQNVDQEDLVLVAGDISWAMRLEQAQKDLEWIGRLPGTKVLIRGNHDYWWGSATQVRAVLPSSMHIISNDAFEWKGVSIGGARLWDTQEYMCGEREYPVDAQAELIYERELGRLERSLKAMNRDIRLVMTHYPPIGFDMRPTRASHLFQQYGVSKCVFGHLHALDRPDLFGTLNDTEYHLTASDYLRFVPKKIL